MIPEPHPNAHPVVRALLERFQEDERAIDAAEAFYDTALSIAQKAGLWDAHREFLVRYRPERLRSELEVKRDQVLAWDELTRYSSLPLESTRGWTLLTRMLEAYSR